VKHYTSWPTTGSIIWPYTTLGGHFDVSCIMYEVAAERDAVTVRRPTADRHKDRLLRQYSWDLSDRPRSTGPSCRPTDPRLTDCMSSHGHGTANFLCLFIAAQMMTVVGAGQSIIYDVDDDEGGARGGHGATGKYFIDGSILPHQSVRPAGQMLLLYGIFRMSTI